MRALRRERRAAQQKRDEATRKRAEKEARRTQAQRLREEQRAQREQQRRFREAEAVRRAAERAAAAEQQRQIRAAEAARHAAGRQQEREIASGYKNACRPFEPRLLTGTIERDDYSPNNNRHFIGQFGSVVCDYCDALLWPGETSSLCCNNGKTVLPPLPTLPPRLRSHPLMPRIRQEEFHTIAVFDQSVFSSTATPRHMVS